MPKHRSTPLPNKNIVGHYCTVDVRLEKLGMVDFFEQVLEYERYITKRIHQLYDLEVEKGDHPLKTLLNWFIHEQVEEEENVTAILDRLKLIGDDGANLYYLDRELAERGNAGNSESAE